MNRLCLFLLAIALTVPAPAAEPPPKKLEGISQAAIQSAFQILRTDYIRNGELTFEELNRAALQGLLQRLHLGAELLMKADTVRPAMPHGLLAEMLTPQIAYLRPLAFAESEVPLMESKLNEFRQAKVPHLILDLRSPAPAGEFRVAAALLDLYVPRGQVLFRLKQVAKEEAELFISNREPIWTSNLIVLVDEETNNLGETIAAVLRQNRQAVIVGDQTRGASVRYETVPLDDHWLLRFARAEVLLPDGTSLFGKGLAPDFPVVLPAAAKRQIFNIPAGIKAIKDTIFDHARSRYNEAALVARKNPELDRYINQSRSDAVPDMADPPKDTVLQRAVDMLGASMHFDAAKMQWPARGPAGKTTVRKAAPLSEP
ncbi:MAG: S41 family peptidase [Prosthecobacter sp.]|nr:S41 family peptidase [Prosthecobacter sp.]